MPYETISNQENIDNNNCQCYALQIYMPNYLSKYIEKLNYNKAVALIDGINNEVRKDVKNHRISSIKELLNIMLKIIWKYDSINKRINLIQMEQCLLENNININKLGFSDLKQLVRLVHNTIYCYSFGNDEFLKINIDERKKVRNVKKKMPSRNFRN